MGEGWTKTCRGFTLIELVLVSAIIGLLAAIAIPKFANLIEKAREAREKGSLGVFRSALSIYYADMEGTFPYRLDGLLPKYIDKPRADWRPWPLPKSIYDNHSSVLIPPGISDMFSPALPPNQLVLNGGDGGEWLYRYSAMNNEMLFNINCTHLDLKGNVWSQF